MTRCLLAVLFAAACGSKPAPTQPQPDPVTVDVSPELNDALAPLAWLVGDWHATEGALRRHWVAAGGTLYGVAFDGPEWSVLVIDDGDGESPTADGELRLIDLGAGFSSYEMRASEVGQDRVKFAGAFTMELSREGSAMIEDADVPVPPLDRGSGREVHGSELVGRDPGRDTAGGALRFARADDPAAPALEAADRQFDADTEAEKVAGWVKWFEPNGVLWRGERIEGRVEIGKKLEKTLTTGHLRWAPIASAAHGDLGFTVGTATWTANDSTEVAWRGSYVTIWRKQPDGSWLVAYDTGRTNQPAK